MRSVILVSIIPMLLAACSSSASQTSRGSSSSQHSGGASSSSQPAAHTPAPAQGAPYTVMANGQPAAVEQYKDVAYARVVASSGTVNLSVGASQAIGNYTISPRSYSIKALADRTDLKFSLSSPSDIIVTVNNLEKLFIFVEAPEASVPSPTGAGVVNLSTYATDNTGTTIQTVQIQKAIDATAALNGGTGGVLYVPDGVYISGTLQVKGNVAVYLQSGARIQGSPNAGDYSHGVFIQTRAASNVKLFGHGVIDASGDVVRSAGAHVKLLQILGGQNIEVDDILLRDSASWSVHVNGARHVTITGLKILNDQSLAGGDGIDPDSSTDVTVNRAFIYTTDDCFAIKTTGDDAITQPASQILIQNSVCWTKKSALKVGTETRSDISNVTFAHDDVVHADRAMALYMSDGATIQGINYLDDHSETIGGDAKQELIEFEITNRGGIGQIRNVTITNYVAYGFSPNKSVIKGFDAAHPVSGVTFNNLSVEGATRLSLASAQVTAKNAIGVTFNP